MPGCRCSTAPRSRRSAPAKAGFGDAAAAEDRSRGLPVADQPFHRSEGDLPLRRAGSVEAVAARDRRVAYDVPGVAMTHRGADCSFDTILKTAGLSDWPPLARLAAIVRGPTMHASISRRRPRGCSPHRSAFRIFRATTTTPCCVMHSSSMMASTLGRPMPLTKPITGRRRRDPMSATETTSAPTTAPPTLGDLTRAFFQIGVLSFGGANGPDRDDAHARRR